jgi:hypothetical protein
MIWSRNSSDVRIGAPVAERNGATWRIAARVDDAEVWFESEEIELTASAEALVSAFLIPSMAAGRRLVCEAPLAADFVDHLPTVMSLASRWWRYPVLPPVLPTEGSAVPARDSSSVALCFSGGVDSFHSLLRGPRRLGLLVLVHGFDVQLTDSARASQMAEMTKQVAAATGATGAVIRTNLRRHPLLVSERWSRDHGGALAAIGHLLPAPTGHLVISSSYPRKLNRPWGSHWDLDPLWSGAGLTVQHYGEELFRIDKLASIGREPLVRKHLRVCWRQPNELPNCSRCTKCVRTRILLSAVGALDGFELLEGNDTLAESIDALPSTGHARALHQYHAALAGEVPPDVAAALRRLLARSRGPVVLERMGILTGMSKVKSLSRRVLARARRGFGEPTARRA